MRAPAAGIRLTNQDAALAKGMIARGDRQHDIAAYFGVNGGRIAELSTGFRFANVPPADAAALPPQGPYIYRSLSKDMRRELDKMKTQLAEMMATLDEALRKL